MGGFLHAFGEGLEEFRLGGGRETRAVVGDCTGGEGDAMSQFANGWDPELAAEIMPVWISRNYLSGAFVDPDDLVATIDGVIRAGASVAIPSVTIAPRPPAS